MCATTSALVLPLEKLWKVREHVVIACSLDRSITVIPIEEIEAIQSNPSRFFDSMFLSRGRLRLAVEDSLCMSLAHPIPLRRSPHGQSLPLFHLYLIVIAL